MADEVRYYRVLLEEMYKGICKLHARWFPDLHARMVFVGHAHGVPHALQSELQGLRKLANEAAHQRHTLLASQFHSATAVLAAGIHYFSSEPIPLAVAQRYEGQRIHTLVVPPDRRQTLNEFDRCVVTAISPPRQEGHDWLLQCDSEFQLDIYQLRLKNHSFDGKYNYEVDFTQLGPEIKPFTKLHLYKIAKDGGEGAHYRTHHESLVVLEPDLLVDVSTVAKCYLDVPRASAAGSDLQLTPYPRWGLLQKLKTTDMSAPLLLGNLANAMLDTYLMQDRPDWPRAIDAAIHAAIWEVLCVGQAEVQQMKSTLLNRHIPNLDALPPAQPGDHDVIEPTFFSVRYGILGRLDFFRESGVNAHRKDIYELKSGRIDTATVKPEHQMQTVGYHLLLRSVYARNAAMTAAVLYAQADVHPVRNITSSLRLEQHFCMTRSRYIGELLRLSEGDAHLLRPDPQAAYLGLPWYTARDIGKLENHFAEASPLEQDYVREYCAFLVRELLHQKVGAPERGDAASSLGFSALWRLELPEKKDAFAIIADLRYGSEQGEERNKVTMLRPTGEPTYAAFRPGDIVLLYPQLDHGRGALRHQVLKATITALDPTQVSLRLANAQLDHTIFRQHDLWCLERDLMESTTFHLLQSTMGLLAFPLPKRQLFLGQAAPRFAGSNPIDLSQIGKSHQESQVRAIQGALSAQDFMLIQGPPGTGKTSRVMAEIVLQIFKHTREVVFLLAYTNRAVDKLLESIHELGKREPQHQIPLLRLTSRADDPDSLAYKARQLSVDQAERLVGETRVFVATIASYQRMQGTLPASIPRDTLIIDEASQVLEPHVAGIIPQFGRFVLIGDHMQLPPIVVQPEAGCRAQSVALERAGMQDLRMSIFERLWRQAERQEKVGGEQAAAWGRCRVTLREHFRMHEDIAQYVVHHYEGGLQLGNPAKQRAALKPASSPDALSQLLAQHRVLFIESPQGEPRRNAVEATRVRKLAQAILGLPASQPQQANRLGVIAPWRVQISGIATEMAQAGLGHIPVDTVERFQGSEYESILISLATSSLPLLQVLCSHASTYAHGTVDRKLNVSLSRAEERVVILGEPAILLQDPNYAQLLRAIRSKGGYVTLRAAQELFSEI